MKNERILKSFAALFFDANAVTGEPAPKTGAIPVRLAPDEGPRDSTTKPDDFRDLLHQRYTAPYALFTPCRHWGINE